MAIKEAHQFKGVSGNPDLPLPPHIEADKDLAARLRARPPLSREVSLHFSDGTFFDVQEDVNGTQYLVLPRAPGGPPHARCLVGEWIVQLDSGKFAVMSDELYRATVEK